MEDMRRVVNKTLAPLSDRVSETIERKNWDAFVAENPSIFLEQQNISVDIRDVFR